jgi:hypothetical protein
MQPGTFTLGTISFSAIAGGRSPFAFTSIRVDDSFGDKLLLSEVPEPSTLLLAGIGFFCVCTLRLRRANRRWCVVAVAFIAVCLHPGNTWADKVTSKTIKPIKDNNDVTGTCSLETKEDDQSLTFSCDFNNASSADVRFVFCAMVDLSNKKAEEVLVDPVNRELKRLNTAKSYHLKEVDAGNGTKKLICEKKDDMGALNHSSVYFGCVEVKLPAKSKNVSVPIGIVKGYKLVTQKFGGGDEKEYPFKNLKARDFSVTYTDQVNLSTSPKTDFDKDSCKDALGQGNFIDYDNSIAARLRSQWALNRNPKVGPWAALQPINPQTVPVICDANGDGVVSISDLQDIMSARNRVVVRGDPRDADPDGRITVNDVRVCTLRLTRQYMFETDPLCVPTGFPAKVPDLPVCPVRINPPPATTVDLNLFTWYTDIQPAGTQMPTVLDVTTSGDLTGLRVETTPPAGVEFNMLGGVDLFGTLRVCSSASLTTCLAPQVPEGQKIQITVNITPVDDDDPPVFESGEFIQDTEPPKVLSDTVSFDSSNNMIVDLLASDVTTSPIHAEFWFSTDNGLTWGHVPLDATSDILADPSESMRAFHGGAGPFTSGLSVQYFIAVEDEVGNNTYFGIGDATP